MKLTKTKLKQIVQEELSAHKKMDRIHSGLRQQMEERLSRTVNIDEVRIAASGSGIELEWNFEKWAALAGMTTTVTTAAVSVALANSTWTTALAVTGPMAISGLATGLGPLGMLVAGMIVAPKTTEKLLRWALKRVASFFGFESSREKEEESDTKPSFDIAAAVEKLISKMSDATNGAMSKEKAAELYGLIINKINEDEDYAKKLAEFAKAYKEKNEGLIARLSAELDDLIEKIIQRDVLQASQEPTTEPEAPEEPEGTESTPGLWDIVKDPIKESRSLNMKLTKSKLKQIIKEELSLTRALAEELGMSPEGFSGIPHEVRVLEHIMLAIKDGYNSIPDDATKAEFEQHLLKNIDMYVETWRAERGELPPTQPDPQEHPTLDDVFEEKK